MYGPSLPDTSDRFPAQSRVEVYYDRKGQWYPGTVTATRIYRPRSGVAHERRLIIDFDNFPDDPIEIGLNGSQVRFLTTTDSKSQRRMTRLARQLAT